MNHQAQNGNGRERLLRAGEVAEMLQVSQGWVRAHANGRKPELPAVKMGKCLRFRPEKIKEFIESCCQ